MDLTREAEIYIKEGRAIFPLLWTDKVAQLIEEFRKLCSHPLEYRKRFMIPTPDPEDPDLQPDNGYLRKDGERKANGEYWDKKDVWHYRPCMWSWYLRNGTDISPHRILLESSHTIFLRCMQLQKEFLRALDCKMPGYNFTSLARTPYTLAKHVLRVILYDPSPPGQKILGKSHRDRCNLTFHIADARPGLRIGEEKILHKVQPDTALVFPGKYAEILTGGKLKALQHEIWEEEPGTPDRRWSIVFFGQIPPPR